MSYKKHVKCDRNPSFRSVHQSGYRGTRWLRRLVAVASWIGCGVLVWHQFAGHRAAPTKANTAVDHAYESAGTALLRAGATMRLPYEPLVAGRSTGYDAREEHSADQGSDTWLDVMVASGDSLSLIFSRLGLPKTDLHEILASSEEAASLKGIRPGQALGLRIEDGRVRELSYEFDFRRSIHIKSVGDQFVAEVVETEPELRAGSTVVEISDSLFMAGQRAGLSDSLIMQLTEIFGWDIDFALDVRDGDHFSVIYDELYKNGEKVKDGDIRAAEFFNRNRRLRAVHYVADDGRSGYYSDRGEAMRKAFLRTPVTFTRISSQFNMRRKHPILNTIRAHKGVDYAAPYGTPIRSTADGIIEFVGNSGGYGNTVVVRHGEKYSTLYAHMSRFGRAAKRGQFIEQGKTIGYVGKTGLATGTHLHYEFRISGVHRNPLTVELPNALPLDKRYIADFKAKSAPLLAELDALSEKQGDVRETLVARVDTDPLTTVKFHASNMPARPN